MTDNKEDFYNSLRKLDQSGGGIIDNSDEEHHQTAISYIFDNALDEIIQYEAEPINDLTGSNGSVALSILNYIDSKLPFYIILPYDRETMLKKMDELPFIIKYYDMYKPSNVFLKVADDKLKSEVTGQLEKSNVDFLSADGTTYTRVTSPANDDKNIASVYIKRDDHRSTYNLLKTNLEELEPFDKE